MRHHTKDKGDEGLGQVIGDLMSNGVQVAVPLSEHLPFDLIAIGEGGAMRRVQVRYRASADAAHLRCELGGWWADRHAIIVTPSMLRPSTYLRSIVLPPRPSSIS